MSKKIALITGITGKAKAELRWQPRTQFKELIELMVDEDIRRLSAC